MSAALDVGHSIESVFVSPEGQRSESVMATVGRAFDSGSRVYELAPGVLERVADASSPQPLLAVAAMPAWNWEMLAGSTFVVVLVDVRDPGNAGTVVRSADAAGADAVIFCQGSVDPFNPKTVRSAAGSLLHLPVVRAVEVADAMGTLADFGLRRLGAAPRDGTLHTQTDMRQPLALVLGNEAAGLGPEVEGLLDGTVTIEMAGRAESINVSMAATVLCFEVSRQRSSLAGMEGLK